MWVSKNRESSLRSVTSWQQQGKKNTMHKLTWTQLISSVHRVSAPRFGRTPSMTPSGWRRTMFAREHYLQGNIGFLSKSTDQYRLKQTSQSSQNNLTIICLTIPLMERSGCKSSTRLCRAIDSRSQPWGTPLPEYRSHQSSRAETMTHRRPSTRGTSKLQTMFHRHRAKNC